MFGISAPLQLLARFRVALGNVCLATLLVVMGPASGYELVENHSAVQTSICVSAAVPLRGEFYRLDRVRTLSATRPVDPTQGNCLERWGIPRSVVGHTLPGGMLAPLRC